MNAAAVRSRSFTLITRWAATAAGYRDGWVFEHVVAALVHGSGYERIATAGCSDRTIRRRLACWADLGLGQALHAAALRAYDQVIGLAAISPARACPPPGCYHAGKRSSPDPGDPPHRDNAGPDRGSALTAHALA